MGSFAPTRPLATTAPAPAASSVSVSLLGVGETTPPSPRQEPALPSPPAGSPAATPAPAISSPSLSSLSPSASPFYPSGLTFGGSKSRRWAELSDADCSDADVSLEPRPASFRDIVRWSPPAPIANPGSPYRGASRKPPRAVAGQGGARSTAADRRRPEVQGRQRKRRRPQTRLVIGLPYHGRDDRRHARLGARPRRTSPHLRLGPRISPPDEKGCRLPVHERLAPRIHSRAAPPDADGWQKVLASNRRAVRVGPPTIPARQPHPPPLQDSNRRRFLADTEGRCFNCLSYSHKVATCRLPTRCLRCRGFRHHAKSCKRPLPASPDLVVDERFSQRVAAPRRQKTSFAQHRRTTSSPAEAAGLPHGPSPAVAAHAGGERRRRRSRHWRRARDSISDAPAGSSGDAAAARAAHGEPSWGHGCSCPTHWYSPCGLVTHLPVATPRMTRCWRSSLLHL